MNRRRHDSAVRSLARPGHSRRGFMVPLLLMIVAIGLIIVWLSRDETRKVDASLIQAQADPKLALTRFFVERQKRFSESDSGWERLPHYMSEEDLGWMERNLERLAGLDRELGAGAARMKPKRQRYAALRVLVDFGPHNERPVISSTQIQDEHAIIYVHQPGRPETLREIALVQEMGRWKIRRYAGTRDSDRVLGELARRKQFDSQPLDDDEKAWLANPVLYANALRARLMTEAGLTPPAGLLPTPTPTPAPLRQPAGAR